MKIDLSKDLKLPSEIAGRRTAVFGISGSGKSNTATVIIEGLIAAGEQVVLIDPKGEGWGLLSLANGKPSNLDLIAFGEPNGHIETLAETHGPRLADFVVETGRSVVLSLLGFESDQSERRFVAAFLRQLYRRKSKQAKRTRTLVVLDEAHLFVPESAGRGFKGDAAELAGAAQRIVRQGRTFGIGSLVIDQRPQDVAKRVITQCDTIICHQLTHNTDRDALREWVRGYDRSGEGEKFLNALASLNEGEAWVWSPSWLKLFQRTKIHRRRTFDSGAAPDGSEAARSVRRAEIDLDQLRGQLAEVVEQAKANDPRELHKQIAELKRQLAGKANHQSAAPQADSKVERQKLIQAAANAAQARDKAWKAAVNERDSLINKLKSNMRMAALRLEVNGSFDPKINPQTIVERTIEPPTIRQTSVQAAPPKQSVRTTAVHPSDLPKGEVATLSALIQFPDGLRREQLTILTTYKRSTRDAYIYRLRERGYVEESGGLIVATDAGRAALPNAEPLPTGEALQNHWLSILPEGEKRILSTLIACYPEAIGRDSLDEATGFKRSTRDAYLHRLAAKQLVIEPARGQIQASENLFD